MIDLIVELYNMEELGLGQVSDYSGRGLYIFLNMPLTITQKRKLEQHLKFNLKVSANVEERCFVIHNTLKYETYRHNATGVFKYRCKKNQVSNQKYYKEIIS